MKIAVIIPTYNERQNVGLLIDKILSLGIKNLSIIVVDDNSPDGTGKLVDKIAEKKNEVMVIHRPRKLGLGSAYKAGFQKALRLSNQVLITMDADFSHNPDVIPRMLTKIKNFDVVIGSRYVKGGKIHGFNVWRHILSGGAQALVKPILGICVRDSTSGFRAYKAEVLKKIRYKNIKSEGYSFLIEVIFLSQQKSFKFVEVPIVYKLRAKGKSKLSQWEIYKAVLTVLRLCFSFNFIAKIKLSK